MTRVRAIVYGIARALRGSAGRPLVSILSIGAIGVSLLLVGLVALATANVAALTARWDRGVQMIVYLTDGTTPERARAIGQVLRSLNAIERVDYVAPDAAWRRLADSLGAQRRDLLDGVEAGFLPGSLEVRLKGGVRSVAAASPVIERLKRTPGVEEVEFLGDWVDRLTALLGALRVAALALTLLVGGACIYVVGGTIQLGMYARRDELEVLRLVGATDGFVQLPLVVEGALQGTIGAAAALGLLYGVYRLGAPTLERLLGSAVGDVRLAFLPAPLVAGALGAGLVLGVLGSWLAIGRHAQV
jgi:cell division transport system permease protein